MLLGIDTGGTFTDAVLFNPAAGADGVIATAKARTTRDLSTGIEGALRAVIDNGEGVDLESITMVSLSTTLATNALVEGRGSPAGLIAIGFDPPDLDNPDLTAALRSNPMITVAGGHDAHGQEITPLDSSTLLDRATAILDRVEAFAITARFGVRNPDHELAAAQVLSPLGLPVVCGHELTSRLNGPRRAATCLLNASIISLIDHLFATTETLLATLGIDAPLMIVRGDGSLAAAEAVRYRPIQTILSGPAASLVGAAYLAGEDAAQEAMVIDMGGTTADVGRIRGGHPLVVETGATVGGHHTMVEAVEMFTHGLGGDSLIDLEQASPTRPRAELIIGPRRAVPLCVAGAADPSLGDHLNRLGSGLRRPTDTWFVRALDPTVGGSRHRATVDNDRFGDVAARLSATWKPWNQVVVGARMAGALHGLISLGRAELCGFTPTDATLILSPSTTDAWGNPQDRATAIAGAAILASLSSTRGFQEDGSDPEAVAQQASTFSRWVVDAVSQRCAQTVLGAALYADGLDPAQADSPLARRAIANTSGLITPRIDLTVTLVGAGAAAAGYIPAAGAALGANTILPTHCEVANAVGAAVATVRVTKTTTITQPSKGKFRIHVPGVADRADLQPAIDDAVAALRAAATLEAKAAGAVSVDIDHDVEIKQAMISGRPFFVEATVTVIATGPPKGATATGHRKSGPTTPLPPGGP